MVSWSRPPHSSRCLYFEKYFRTMCLGCTVLRNCQWMLLNVSASRRSSPIVLQNFVSIRLSLLKDLSQLETVTDKTAKKESSMRTLGKVTGETKSKCRLDRWCDYQNTFEVEQDVLLERRLQVWSLKKENKKLARLIFTRPKHSFIYDRRDGRERKITKNLVEEWKENK